LELETQMLQNLEAFGLDAVQAVRKSHLRQLLRNDRRGVIVTTIHKFDGIEKDLVPRRNVIILVDEAHRSQEGNLGIFLRAALPNAFHFGFTGTPIDRGKVGQGTYETFGSAADPDGVHDAYTINESIEDGTTLLQSGEERTASNLDNLAFALRMTLKATPVLSALEDGALDTLAAGLADYLQQHTGWPHNGKMESSVRMQLYKLLLPQMPKPFKPEAVNELVNNLLKMHRLTL
ncbi:MAG: DEAD/DEAH box helicase family protein, partial [Caldilineaceae bacterium]|nr:DEAD/DEAH box helicase family protein [Caldilineaceae bacterium]